MANLRVGQGFDVHRLVSDRRLVIGGVEIPFEKGLLGHSDADVLLHSIADALLGAAGLPDIGYHFPPTDMRFKDAHSMELLKEVVVLITEAGCRAIVNVDCVIMAERPKMSGYIASMKRNISSVLKISDTNVGIKATTCEKLGFVGREEGIAASTVCLVEMHG